MPFLLRHLLRHKIYFQAIREASSTSLTRYFDKGTTPLRLPGPKVYSIFPPLAPSLVRDYLREVGANEFNYDGVLPAHLFPYWVLPSVLKSIACTPYPIHKTLNGGCELKLNNLIPADEPIELSSQLAEIRKTERHITFVHRSSLGTNSAPNALETVFYGILPLKASAPHKKPERAKQVIPDDVNLLETLSIPKGAGLRFSLLTGDVNPIHWLPPYAKLFGFPNTILHGFGTLARVMETFNKALTNGDPREVTNLEVRFTRPLVLPAKVGIYHGKEGTVYVGTGLGELPYLTGKLTLREKG